jgi:hypothetical protein
MKPPVKDDWREVGIEDVSSLVLGEEVFVEEHLGFP